MILICCKFRSPKAVPSERNDGTQRHIFVPSFPEVIQTDTVNVYWHRLMCIQRHSDCHGQRLTARHIYCTNCTVRTWNVHTVITQKLLLHVQLHNSTAHLLYRYCTNCTVCKWTVLTVITQKLLQHVQLHNNTAHLLYRYCTNCTVCNWTVLTVITQKLLLHVQLHNNTAHLLYKYCTNCTVCNWTDLTVSTHKLLLHVQLHNNTETFPLMSSEMQCCRLLDILRLYTDNHIQRFDPSKQFSWL
jgi:Pyruvate/2-oxoacid:ferredoxin oxidoreductase delta subunit